jgi:hypothetical protein
VKAALERICASPSFDHAPKLTRFLRFVVEAALSGRADRLKGYTIGVEALGRRPDFDPQVDPIVRVEAIRLRAALRRYYEGEGALDRVLIDIPRGRYVPVFGLRERRSLLSRLRRAIAKMLRVLNMQVTIQLRLTDP